MRRKKLRQQRPEAFWGAVIGAGASILSSLIGGKSQADSAQAEADAILQASKENAKALEEQNRNNNLLQKENMKFIADQNAQARQLQMDMQTSGQLQAGYDSMSMRRRDNRIVVKKGGKVTSRKKLRDAFFYGGGNLPFRVTDGGGVLPLGQTPEGYGLYEIIGNDHDHYHKTKNGKYKSGVGIKFDNGQIVEGEGNQNGKQGEYLMVTPDSGMFLSKHNINGFNPVKAINAGMPPMQAYAMQEASKGSSPVKRNKHKATAGILVNDILPLNYPIYDINNMTRRQLKRGGRCKALYGNAYIAGPESWNSINFKYPMDGTGYSIIPTTINNNLYSPGYTSGIGYNTKRNRWNGVSGNILGAGITGLGNLLGAGISNYFINRGASIGAAGALEAARIQGNALRNLQTVDMSMLEGDSGKLMFSRGHYMPATESTKVYDNAQREDIRRMGRRAQDATARGSLSSAARLSRMSGINSTGQEMLSKVYDTTANQEAENRRANMAAINEAGARNIQLDIEALRDRTSARLDLLKYNNDIVNRRIAEPAQVEAEALANAAGIRSAAKNAIGQGWASAIAGTGQAFGNAFAMDAKQRNDLQMARVSATRAGELNYLKYYASPSERNMEVNRLNSIINNPNSTPDQIAEARRERAHITGEY